MAGFVPRKITNNHVIEANNFKILLFFALPKLKTTIEKNV